MTPVWIALYDPDPKALSITYNVVGSVEGIEIVGHGDTISRFEQILNRYSVNLAIIDPFSSEESFEQLAVLFQDLRPKVDVIVVSHELGGDSIVSAFRMGAFDYIAKPFIYERYRESLYRYRCYHSFLVNTSPKWNQKNIDLLKRIRMSSHFTSQGLPKGLHNETLSRIRDVLRQTNVPLSASDIAKKTKLARSTVWKYLSYLCQIGEVMSFNQYTPKGRPLRLYSLLH